MSQETTTRWMAGLLVVGWWFADSAFLVRTALSPFSLIGEPPAAVVGWTVVAGVLVQVGESLTIVLPFIVAAMATVRSARVRRWGAVLILAVSIVATHWLRPQADARADAYMSGSDASLVVMDARQSSTTALVATLRTSPESAPDAAFVGSVVWTRLAATFSACVLMMPLLALGSRRVVAWYWPLAACVLQFSLNMLLFRSIAPRLAATWGAIVWTCIPAVVATIVLMSGLRQRQAEATETIAPA